MTGLKQRSLSGMSPELRNKLAHPLVSVVIPSLPHRKESLARAIASIKKQTYPHIEIIVEYGGKNVQDARNIGIKRSKGKYIALLDDDDEFYPANIEKKVAWLEANKKTYLCISWGDDYKFNMYHQYQPKEWWSFKELIDGFNITCTSAFIVRRTAFEKFGMMDDTFNDNHEYDLAVRCAQEGPIYCYQESLVRFNQSDDNWSNDYGKKIRGMFEFTSKWGKYYALRRWRNTIACFILFSLAIIWPAPVNKIFLMTKIKAEMEGKE